VKLIGLNLFRNRKYFKTQEMMDIEWLVGKMN
jgi:hypothetical protein